jgi:hypothetical protein
MKCFEMTTESHTEKCLPREKLQDCDDEAWQQLPAVFNGIRCPVATIRNKVESVEVDLSRVGHQLPAGAQGPLLLNFFLPQVTTFHNKLERLSLESLSSLV